MTLIYREITLHFLVCIIELCGICEVFLTLIIFIILQYVFLIVANNCTETTGFRLKTISITLPNRKRYGPQETEKTRTTEHEVETFTNVLKRNTQKETERLSLKPMQGSEIHNLIHQIIPDIEKALMDCGVKVSIFGNPKNTLLLCVFRASCGPSTWLPVPFLLWVLPAFRGMWPYDFPYPNKSLCILNLMSENGMTRFKINQQDQWGHFYSNLSVSDKISAYIRSITAMLSSPHVPSIYPHTNSDNRRPLSNKFYQGSFDEEREYTYNVFNRVAKQGRTRSFDTHPSQNEDVKIQHTVVDYTYESKAMSLFHDTPQIIQVGYTCKEVYPPHMENWSSFPTGDKDYVESSAVHKSGEARAAVLNITDQRECDFSIIVTGRKKNPGGSIIFNSNGWRRDTSKMSPDSKSSIFAFGVGSSVLLIVKKGWVFIGVRIPGVDEWIFDHTLFLNATKTLGREKFYIEVTLTGRGYKHSMAITTPDQVPHLTTPKNNKSITTLGFNSHFVAKSAEPGKLSDLINQQIKIHHPDFLLDGLWKNSDDIFNIGDSRQMSEDEFRKLSVSIIKQGFLPPSSTHAELKITHVFSIKINIHGSDKKKVLSGFLFSIPGIHIGKKTGVLSTSNVDINDHLRIEKMLGESREGVSIKKIPVDITLNVKIESRLGRS